MKGTFQVVILVAAVWGLAGCSAASRGKAAGEADPVIEGEGAAGECAFEPIYFDYDESTINPAGREALDRVVPCILKSDRVLVVEGYTDERGTEEYNLELGNRMARQVARYLEKAGLPKARLKTVSYGEERPPCTEATEECWAQCRRVEIRFDD